MTHEWYGGVLGDIARGSSSIAIVQDNDSIFSHPELLNLLSKQGIPVYEFESSVGLRYYLEWICPKNSQKKIITISGNFSRIPFDIRETADKYTFTYRNLVPWLPYSILRDLQIEQVAALTQLGVRDKIKGNKQSREFVLRALYDIYPEQLNSLTRLYAALINFHYTKKILPRTWANHVVNCVTADFGESDFINYLESSESFWTHIQERWAEFVNNYSPCAFKVARDCLDFSVPHLRVWLPTLISEEFLKPVKSTKSDFPDWIKTGIQVHSTKASPDLDLYLGKIKSVLESKSLTYHDWVSIAHFWGRYLCEYLGADSSTKDSLDQSEAYWAFKIELDSRFHAWLTENYNGLALLPPLKPVMVHHVTQKMLRDYQISEQKSCLLVIDGLALDQWYALKSSLIDTQQKMKESCVFAWIPTLTEISRQAIFAGKPPIYFADTIRSTAAEPKLWRTVWTEVGVSEKNIVYQKNILTVEAVEKLTTTNPTILGLVVNVVDDLIHGCQFGKRHMQHDLELSDLRNLFSGVISALTRAGYRIYLTSDHGNTEAFGEGNISEGRLADRRGERARFYSSQELAQRAFKETNIAQNWSATGLPDSQFMLLAAAGKAFTTKDKLILSHGGASLEEVIVPFIEIERLNS